MDTQHLKAFIAVAESGSFSGAAEELHLTQPAVSKRIATLESQLNTSLFDRLGRAVQLTEGGRALLPRARQILQEVRDAVRSIDDLRGEVSGALSLGISHHIGLHRLPPVLESFSRQFQEVRFDIHFMDSEEAYELITLGSIELGVVTLDPGGTNPLHRRPIWRDKLLFVASRNHPLCETRHTDLKTLSQHTAILPGLNTYTGQIIKALFRKHSLNLDVSMETNYLETIKMMVSIGLGWSVLPHTMIDDTITPIPLEGIALERTLGCVYHPGRSLSNAAEAFLAALDKARDADLSGQQI